MQARRERFIERMGMAFETDGATRIMGRIFGLLLLSGKPVALDEIAESLGVSRASVSTDARKLLPPHLQPLELQLHVGAVVRRLEDAVLLLEVEERARGDGHHQLAGERDGHAAHDSDRTTNETCSRRR